MGLRQEGIVKISEDVQVAVVTAAKTKGLKVVVHTFLKDDALVVLRAGIRSTAHTFYDKPMTQRLLQRTRRMMLGVIQRWQELAP